MSENAAIKVLEYETAAVSYRIALRHRGAQRDRRPAAEVEEIVYRN